MAAASFGVSSCWVCRERAVILMALSSARAPAACGRPSQDPALAACYELPYKLLARFRICSYAKTTQDVHLVWLEFRQRMRKSSERSVSRWSGRRSGGAGKAAGKPGRGDGGGGVNGEVEMALAHFPSSDPPGVLWRRDHHVCDHARRAILRLLPYWPRPGGPDHRGSRRGRQVGACAATCASGAACPGCGVLSRRVHSHYQRRLSRYPKRPPGSADR